MSELISYRDNEDVKKLQSEIERILDFAERREILTQDDLKPATDDLAVMGKFKSALEELRTSYVKPLNNEVKSVNVFFRELSEPLAKANGITRDKVKAFMVTNTEPEEKPGKVRSYAGTTSTRMVAKYEITDKAKVPSEFWAIDEKLLAAQIRAGRRDIDGVKIWEEPELTVRSNQG